MANTVGTVEDVRLLDGTDITLRSASIATLRKVLKRVEEFGKAEDEDQFFEMVLNASAFCLRKERPDFYQEDKNNGEDRILGGATESFEESVDMPTVYKILEIVGGVKLNDPNLLAAATAATLGTN